MADPTMLDGTRMTCYAMRIDWSGTWYCSIGALHSGPDGRPVCDFAVSFKAVCDDFGNLVEVRHG